MSQPPRNNVLFPLMGFLSILAGCQQADSPPEPVGATVSLDGAGIPNLRHPAPNLHTSGQIEAGHLETLSQAGVRDVICLRGPAEPGTGFEEAAAPTHGLRFTRLPIPDPTAMNRANVEELDRLLAESAGRPTLLYCGSSNRVGALMALRAHWLGGQTPEQALEIGRQAGLTKLEPKIREQLGMPVTGDGSANPGK